MTIPAPPFTDAAYPAWLIHNLLGYQRVAEIARISETTAFNACKPKGYQHDPETFIELDAVCLEEHGTAPFADWYRLRLMGRNAPEAPCLLRQTVAATEVIGRANGVILEVTDPASENGTGLSARERGRVREAWGRVVMSVMPMLHKADREVVR